MAKLRKRTIQNSVVDNFCIFFKLFCACVVKNFIPLSQISKDESRNTSCNRANLIKYG